MTETKSQLPLWPFLTADALFLGLAGLLLRQGHKPLLWWEGVLLIACVAAAGCFLIPFFRRNHDEQAASQAKMLTEALNQIQKIDQVAAQMIGATNQWREFQLKTDEISASTKSLGESMAAEAKAFSEFLQKANDGEKARWRLEAEKLRRAETDWLQIVIHILDHVTALHKAALQSGQPGLIEQINQFQTNCREAARRVGVAPTFGREGDAFDPALHQLTDSTAPAPNAIVTETLVPGYTFQGQLARRTVVALKG